MEPNLKGKLYLLPVMLGDNDPNEVLPVTVSRTMDFINDYVVENSKAARKFIKAINPNKVQAELNLFELNKHTEEKEIKNFIIP